MTLLDLFSNSVVLYRIAPYLPVSSIHALAVTSKAFRWIVQENASETFRYCDLSKVKSAALAYEPIDTGGVNWRSQRMDESLTEAEFYSGPLRGVFSKLAQKHILKHVQILVLDGLSVPADLVHDILIEDRFNVRVLSIREVKNLDEKKLMQVLRYAVRPSRPANTPRLRALYIFQPRNTEALQKRPANARKLAEATTVGVTTSEGAQIGATWNQKSQDALNLVLGNSEDRWYQSSGKMFKKPLPEWGTTLKECQDIIAFDAVLCRGPRHDINVCPQPKQAWFLPPSVASVALGPSGCAACGSCPEGAAIYGQSPSCFFPLLSPPPLHSASVRAAQAPLAISHSQPAPDPEDESRVDDDHQHPLNVLSGYQTNSLALIVRCEACLQGRWCVRCNRWWDEECYVTPTASTLGLEASSEPGESWKRVPDSIKVHLGLCAEHCLVGEMMQGAGSFGMWG